MRTLIGALLALTLSSAALACPNHIRLKVGDQAPCSGHFFNDITEQRIRKDVRDNQLRKKQVELKKLQIQKMTEDRDDWKRESEKQSKARHEMGSDLTKGFLSGIGLTLIVIFVSGRISK